MAETDAAVPTVNPEPQPVAPSESSVDPFVDPMFTEDRETALPDEPAAAAEAAEPTEPAEQASPTAEQLRAVVEANPDAEDADAEAEAGSGDEDEDEAGEATEQDAGEAEEAAAADEGDRAAKRPRRRRSTARRERRALERRLAAIEAENAALRAERTAQPAETADAEQAPAEQAEELKRPKLEDFDYDNDAFSEALAEYTDKRIEQVREEQRAEKAAAEKALADKAEEARMTALSTAFNERQDKARAKYDDYDEQVYDPDAVIPASAAPIIFESEVGPELAYYLATHDEEAEKLVGLDDVRMARELGRIEARLMAEQAPPAAQPAGDQDPEAEGEQPPASNATPPGEQQPARPTPTRAPAPVPRVRPAANVDKNPANMSYAEYEEGRLSGKIK